MGILRKHAAEQLDAVLASRLCSSRPEKPQHVNLHTPYTTDYSFDIKQLPRTRGQPQARPNQGAFLSQRHDRGIRRSS